MDKINKPKKQFPCSYCNEKPFTTLQNLKRHITRKHPNISETKQESDNDNISVLSTDTTIIPINYQSETEEPKIEIPKPEPIPGDEYLITLIREYEKYQHLFPAIKRQMKWNENNATIDLHYHLRKHNKNMVYLMVDIRDVKLPIN